MIQRLLLLMIITSINVQAQNKAISVEELLGKGDPELYGKGINLRKEAYECFVQMQEAAAREGIVITIASSYRSYESQRKIWERKFKRFTANGLSPSQAVSKIVEYSTIPGTSRHHWGTDIDIIDGTKKVKGDVLIQDNYENGGPYAKLKQWMDKNAHKFGYYLVYTNDSQRKGFNYEPWHYSYAPLSISYLKQYRELAIKEQLLEYKLLGAKAFTDSFINSYIDNNILDINPELL
ncbi:M15 family metallopeptidase [Zhouia amylolytica]|uniref:D-alanyl-D-alanine carboxypeptidase family protein n=1 Tax=Zhouia amylolytica AD3 TaxID=1286632 RepID=W2UM75_9FLAO|nr:M15 family metallopeptidase [Zhouia amylolytica]ETN95245.1 D-alanyl-D-alanine carboxypeptidase family protein [Zhouia amylolytica AD3]